MCALATGMNKYWDGKTLAETETGIFFVFSTVGTL